MAIVSVVVPANKMKINGATFDTWIVTGSDSPPMVCLGAQENMHCESYMARQKTFVGLQGDPKGVWITGFCKTPIAANSSLVINLLQEGTTQAPTPTRPVP